MSREHRNQSMRRRSGANRNCMGSVLAEGTAGIVILASVAVPLVVYLVNLATQLLLQEKVAHIANQAAQAVDDKRYWLGLPRPGYDQSLATEKAKAIAQDLCHRIGLQNASVDVRFDDSNTEYDITTCDINVNAVAQIPFRTVVFGYDFASLFPGNVKARGVATHAKIIPYALIHMDAPHAIDQVYRRPLGYNERDVAVLPAYGFFYTAVAGTTRMPTPYGKGLAPGLSPENFFSMNHYHLKKTDIEHVTATGDDIQLSGWHPGRVINGKEVTF
ncbi:MAG: hypothetical protein K2X93_28625 [Candidatus Obscuribacterales bacterium]|nr:hypothetical protein [Candidatus Obscuribacterales bacterium]